MSARIAPAVEAVRADLIEAAKVTGAFQVSPAPEDAGPVSVTAVELGRAPTRTLRDLREFP